MQRQHLLLGALALAFTGAAQADWSPRIQSGQYVATVSYGGGSLSYAEDWRSGGPLGTLAGQMKAVPYSMQNGLNEFMRASAASQGVNFQSGTLSGDVNVQIQPQANGTVLMTLGGVRYDAYTQFSGKRWGIISYSCVNHASLANLQVTAQYGAATGELPSDKIGVTANVGSSTDCDSNLSWMLPILGNIIINKAEGKIDQGVLDGVKGSLGMVKDGLFFGRDQNYLTGLNKLIPADKVVTLPNGQTFPIGQYVNNNLAYLIANSQVSVQLGKGAVVQGVYGTGEPTSDIISGNVITLNLSAPGMNFTVNLTERLNVMWQWKCSLRDPTKSCPIP
ncbi:hypothetical protein [Pelomonas sp. BJYL3]|uniref:hypothetical protein n=1 Tax=Pelomonas sp. BJYL3 TaxID=2976697 RepID=UPI0022B42B21|nr:hypothetical protein [Pelomonas sp. BJYL3]